MSGSVLGPAIGPCLGGIIIAYVSWRVLFWVQTGMVGIGFILAAFFVPSVKEKTLDVSNIDEKSSMFNLRNLAKFNPINSFKMLRYPNVLITVGWSFNFDCSL